MKKLFISWIFCIGLIISSVTPVFAEGSEYVSGTFDWLYLSNHERTERVQK